ncbi:MAG: hypothetical protein I8H73_10810 [Pseudomonadales bacterium]|nr:hypothetical protein [Pseudomonadales bacterium]
MNKIIKWAVLGLLAVALLIKLSLWLSVRSVMDDAIEQMAPHMVIKYSGITSSFDGRIGLEKVEIRVPALNDELRVAHAELRFHGLGELLRFKERLAEGKFPEQMAVKLQGLALDVHGPFMAQLYSQPAERSVFTAMSEVACGKVRNIGTGELLDMGYRTFETDAEFSYRFEPGAQKLNFNLRSDTRDMAAMQVSMTLANMSEKPGDLRANPPRVSLVTVEVSDNQYQRKVQEYCAGKVGQDTKQYVQTAVAQFDRVLRSQRIALEPPVLAAYGRYLQDPQSLRLEFNPTEGMVWDGLQFFDAKDVLAMLRPVVLVNQEVVEPLGFTWVDPNVSLAVKNAAEPAVADQPVSAAPGEQRPQFVAVEQLPSYAGKRLQFITFDGAYYQGVLHRVENGKVYLSVQFQSGSAEMSLRLDKIHQVRVLL